MNLPLFPAVKIGFPKLVQLSLTVGEDSFTITESKMYDISFISYPSSPLRIKVYSFLKKYAKKNRLTAFLFLGGKHSHLMGAHVIPYDKYINIIANSKLSFAIQGVGFDTYRYWEIPFCCSTLVSQKPYIFIENNFEDGENAIFFKSFKELEQKLDYYLLKDRWETVCRNGQLHFLKKSHLYSQSFEDSEKGGGAFKLTGIISTPLPYELLVNCGK